MLYRGIIIIQKTLKIALEIHKKTRRKTSRNKTLKQVKK